jgi:hypothetical protein
METALQSIVNSVVEEPCEPSDDAGNYRPKEV